MLFYLKYTILYVVNFYNFKKYGVLINQAIMNIPADFSFTLGFWQTFLIAALFVWVYCLVDIARHEFKNDGKITWLLIVLFLPILGSVLYLSTGKCRRILKV